MLPLVPFLWLLLTLLQLMWLMLYLMWFRSLQWSRVCLVLDCLHERWSVVLAGAAEQVLMVG
ncbi:hypothetical protein NEISUBOT_04420 [Neisseria subflava NJ9703]|uniref:Uncharacterized protein n=1 Tax=Neisseria subflava NJ9703 TaxID=546268 RepID=A0A9W5IQN9_NEISU|nr:hypothetical protein NEISUBOT_04420 [Neisseria subflava NJ9703]